MIRKLCYYGNPILRKKCKPVEKITDDILRIAKDLVDSMISHNGSGLAAPQIGVDLRIFVISLSDENDDEGFALDAEPTVFINPIITRKGKSKGEKPEGCLSIPGIYEPILRPIEIDIEAIGVDGKIFQEKGLKNWRSRCFQHELDHLDGVLTIDRYPLNIKDKYKHQLLVMEKQYLDKSIITKEIFF